MCLAVGGLHGFLHGFYAEGTSLALFFDQNEENAVYDQGNGNDDIIHQMRIQKVIQEKAENGSRHNTEDDLAKELDQWLAQYELKARDQMKQVPNAGEYPDHYRRVRVNFRRSQLQNPERRPALPYKYTDPKLTWIF